MRIIWAMDAFEDNKELNQKMAETLSNLFERTRAEIEPLYLLRENEIVLPTYEVPTWVTDHSRTAESLFREVLEDYNLPFLQEPHVIPHASQSHSGAAEVLSDYALRTKADMIVVGSHGRQGFQRFILGSFAESLLLQSEVPVYVVGAQCTHTTAIKNILFPTEFGDHSKDNFRHVLEFAKMFQAEITLFHAVARPIESLFDLDTRPKVYNYKGKMLTLDQILEHQVEHQTQRAHRWMDWALKEGVPASFRVDTSFQAIDKLILESVDRDGIDLIIMEAQSGPMSAAILGSYTRNIVRAAHCPVYVLTRHFYDHQEDRFADSPAP
ncbi:universal stress protein [Bdellovibrio svalbardensis]|uniref:Universal stress protein n=1 Tax=Bdellovibrio svalbardensis TaxID=2972972 RepID=A0ABT6DHR4_9BACT|nr:universal stress protein [Bdellovibrio svalbardensis]MDG0816398.1 universal stress protein [Bdellovibrio svalbardensis]